MIYKKRDSEDRGREDKSVLKSLGRGAKNLIVITAALATFTFPSSPLLQSSAVNFNDTHAKITQSQPNSTKTSRDQLAQTIPYTAVDEQIGITFINNMKSLDYYVTAKSDTDANGYGSAFLLNGLTNKGDWFQLGLAYNFGTTTEEFVVFTSILPKQPSSQMPKYNAYIEAKLNMPVKIASGDKIGLKMYIQNGKVFCVARDVTQNAQAVTILDAKGATTFIGNKTIDENGGVFTGLMTESWHSFPEKNAIDTEIYTPATPVDSKGWLWIDEFSLQNYRNPHFLISKDRIEAMPPSAQASLTAENIKEEYLPGGVFVTEDARVVKRE